MKLIWTDRHPLRISRDDSVNGGCAVDLADEKLASLDPTVKAKLRIPSELGREMGADINAINKYHKDIRNNLMKDPDVASAMNAGTPRARGRQAQE